MKFVSYRTNYTTQAIKPNQINMCNISHLHVGSKIQYGHKQFYQTKRNV